MHKWIINITVAIALIVVLIKNELTITTTVWEISTTLDVVTNLLASL